MTGLLTIPDSVVIISSSAFNGCSRLTGPINIPSSVTAIGSNAFFFCGNFTSLTLPSNVASIGAAAFANCVLLATIYIYNHTPPVAVSNAFDVIDKTLCILHVPVGSISAYDTAAVWTDFVNIVEDL